MVSSNIHPKRDQLAIIVLEAKQLAEPTNPAFQRIKPVSNLREMRGVPSDQAAAALVAHEPLATVTILSLDGGNVAPRVASIGATAMARKKRRGQQKNYSI